jgi:DNA-binding transcriptional ArsR family regulator
MARSSKESAIRYPLTAILGVDSNLRVLRVLSLHGGMLASNEIIRKSRLAQESVRRALIDLVSLGIVLSSGMGRSSVYRLNADHYFSSALSELFKAESDRFQAILDAVRQCATEMPIFSLFYYGSVASGKDRTDSDLDIGVIAHAADLAKTTERLRENLRDASERLGFLPNLVGLDFADIKRLDRDADPWWKNVISEAIVLSGKRPEDAISMVGEERG